MIRRRAGAWLAALTAVAAVVATQWPFRYRVTEFALRARWRRVDWSWMPRNGLGHIRWDRDFAQNLVMLLPLGLGYGLWRGGRAPAWRIGLEALAIGAAFSASLEAAQLLTPERYTSFADFWRNALGCAVGALASRVFARPERPLRPTRAP